MGVADRRLRAARMMLPFLVALTLAARPAQATPMSWELTGTIGNVTGLFANYLADGMPFRLTFTADADQPASIPPYCPPDAHAAEFLIAGRLQVGDFTYTGASILQRHNDAFLCGQVGYPLSSRGFNWRFVGVPPDRGLGYLSQVFDAFFPVDDTAATLGEQFAPVTNGLIQVVGSGFRSGFTGDGTFAPVPEPGTCALLAAGLVGLAARRRRIAAPTRRR